VDGALDDLYKLVRRLSTPVLMALDDTAVWLLQRVSDRLETKLTTVSGHQGEVALDKRLQLRAALDAGFAVPETQELVTQADLKTISFFPAILKPALAARARDGRLGRESCRIIAKSEDLSKFELDEREPMLAQPLLRGVGEGIFGLAVDSGVVCWSSHRRVRMMNPSGSGSSACISIKADPDLCLIAERFVKGIGWRGMFMIELLRDVNGQPWFMELNGRAWGSMALARRMGYEYPSWNAQYLVNPGFIPCVPAEKPPVLCRHAGRELLHLTFIWRGPASPVFPAWPSLLAACREVLRIDRRDAWYNYNPDDWKVFWADTWQTLLSPIRKLRLCQTSRDVLTRILNRVRLPWVRHQQAQIRKRGDVLKLLTRNSRILFICYGNINRSALAEQHLKSLMAREVHVASCGFHTRDRRPIDPSMALLAQDVGVNFAGWSSRRINHDLISQADVIFTMETAHLIRLLSNYPQARGRAFLLSCVTKSGTTPLEIKDPFGGRPEDYRRCIKEITFATLAISERMKV